MKKRRSVVGLSFFLISSSVWGLTLEESVKDVISSNPIVQERLKNYRATQQDLKIAESEYYPSLDLRATAGYSNVGELKEERLADRDFDYTNYEASLTLTQNLFEGFATMHKVDYQEARILAAAYNYLEKTNDVAFQMTSAYIGVLKAHELLQTAQENVAINKSSYEKVQQLFDAGLTADSEVKKIQASLSLAKSNYTVQKNNLKDAEYAFRKVLGRLPDVENMQKPMLDIAMPESLERAAMFAIKSNPSLLVSNYNIKGANALYKQRQKDYYPKVDVAISQFFNDVSRVGNGYDQTDDRFRARIILNYNLFRGGADVANVQKHLSTLSQEVDIKRDLKRQVIESLDYSWNAYEMIALQLEDLREYSEYAETTLDLFKDEYDMGRRTILDLLSAQNDVINARNQIITAEYDYLFAKYRILDAMGLMVMAILKGDDSHLSIVNLWADEDAHEILDKTPVKFDIDRDAVVDDQDLCDNCPLENNIMPYGCKKMINDSDRDGVVDELDKCSDTPLGVKVSPDGCPLDSDMDGVPDYLDECPDTPLGHEVDTKGCSIFVNLGARFQYASHILEKRSIQNIDKFYDFLQENRAYKVHIVGHTDSTGIPQKNEILSVDRAKSLETYLVNKGIPKIRITHDGRGQREPKVDNNTSENRYINRRVEIELIEGEK